MDLKNIFILLILIGFGIHLCMRHNIQSSTYTILKHSFNRGSYNIFEFHNILTKEECSIIINEARPDLKRSGIMSETNISTIRTSTNTFLHKDTSKNIKLINILNKIDKITEQISGKPKQNQEPLQVVKYTKDQEYKEHYDCCVPFDSKICQNDRKNFGLRHSTFLIYLNDVEKGGETNFPKLNYKFSPKMGNAIFFFNLNQKEDYFNELSKHAGLPPNKNEKWVCNKWIRTKQYNSY